MRRLSMLCLGLSLAAPALAAEGYVAPREGQTAEGYRDAASDAYEGEGRLRAIRGLSSRMGDLQQGLVNGLRLRGLLRLHLKAGVDAGEARAWLVERGMAGERADAAVSNLMRADADGDGRVTLSEFDAAQGSRALDAVAAIRDAIGEAPSNRKGWDERAAALFGRADADHDGRISAAEAADFALGKARR